MCCTVIALGSGVARSQIRRTGRQGLTTETHQKRAGRHLGSNPNNMTCKSAKSGGLSATSVLAGARDQSESLQLGQPRRLPPLQSSPTSCGCTTSFWLRIRHISAFIQCYHTTSPLPLQHKALQHRAAVDSPDLACRQREGSPRLEFGRCVSIDVTGNPRQPCGGEEVPDRGCRVISRRTTNPAVPVCLGNVLMIGVLTSTITTQPCKGRYAACAPDSWIAPLSTADSSIDAARSRC